MTHLEAAVQQMIDATNRGDSDALVAAFAETAVLVDFGRAFTGRAEIAGWNDKENIGTQNHINITDVQRSGNTTNVRIRVTGNGYNGPGTLAFSTDEDGLITRLNIFG